MYFDITSLVQHNEKCLLSKYPSESIVLCALISSSKTKQVTLISHPQTDSLTQSLLHTDRL